jgi:hypothetical protein
LASKAQSSAQALIGAIRLSVALSRPRIIPNPACEVFNLTMVRLWQKWADVGMWVAVLMSRFQ